MEVISTFLINFFKSVGNEETSCNIFNRFLFLWQAFLGGAYFEANVSYDYSETFPTEAGTETQVLMLLNLVFGNSKKVEEIGFVTASVNAAFSPFRAEVVYDLFFHAISGFTIASPLWSRSVSKRATLFATRN